MTGRWMMVPIQTSFAVMPALVYLFAGHFAERDLARHGRRLHHAAGAALLPDRLLLGVGLEVQTSLALFDRVFEYLDQPVDIEEGPRALDRVRGDVAFEGVWFRYDDAAWTLQEVSFEVPAGSKTASSGRPDRARRRPAIPSRPPLRRNRGTGHDRRRGRARADLRPARERGRRFVIVRRIFHATVRENLRFARPDATDDEVEEAARAAQIHELVASLPTATRPSSASAATALGGERQRIAIARTILRNLPILVLDEATSALDTQTERAVQEALERLAEGRTTIAIAHRLSNRARRRPDRRPRPRPHAEIGTHEEPLTAGGRYATPAARDAEEVFG